MKKIDLYPSLINWTFLIGGCLAGSAIRYDFRGVPVGASIALLVIFSELNRARKIANAIEKETTPDFIRIYYSKDAAHKWIPWRDQARGINQVLKDYDS